MALSCSFITILFPTASTRISNPHPHLLPRRPLRHASPPVRLSLNEPDTAHRSPSPLTTSPHIRPRNLNIFSIPFQHLVIRPWRPLDTLPCANLISSVLAEYALHWDPLHADRDVLNVQSAYQTGEFWVVENISTAQIVATAAFYEVPQRGHLYVEIRKLYLHKHVRGMGLGSFLLSALEHRARQLGYITAVVETASVMKEANCLYISRGYRRSTGVEVDRCDVVLEKTLTSSRPRNVQHLAELIDMTQGWTVGYAPKSQLLCNRLLFRSVAVLVHTADKVVVHRRSYHKSAFAGKMAALITGFVDWNETPLMSAKREVMEELGLSNLTFSTPFAPFIADGDGTGYRIQFHPFIASANFCHGDIIANPKEVESVQLMTREQIIGEGIGGSLWKEFRKHGL